MAKRKRHQETPEMLKLAVFHIQAEQWLLDASEEYRKLQKAADKSVCNNVAHNKLSAFRKNPARMENLSHMMGADHAGITRVLKKSGYRINTGANFPKACKAEGISTKSLRGGR